MDLIERFRYIMKLNNLTASAFAESIGVQPSSVSHILSGRNKPSLEFIQKIIVNYPKIDAAWLINGTTSVHVDKIKIEETSPPINEERPNPTKTESDSSNKVESKDELIEKIVVFYTNGTFKEFRSLP